MVTRLDCIVLGPADKLSWFAVLEPQHGKGILCIDHESIIVGSFLVPPKGETAPCFLVLIENRLLLHHDASVEISI
jgi:hypothetical protein